MRVWWVILTRAGLGLDPVALRCVCVCEVCVRVCVSVREVCACVCYLCVYVREVYA